MYDLFFQEIVRQVSLQCRQRGALLQTLRAHYASLFRRVPESAAHLKNQLQAQTLRATRLAAEAGRSIRGLFRSVFVLA